MMSVYVVGESGNSFGIQKMIYMMNQYLKKLLIVVKIKDKGNPPAYTFIALFQESGSVGNFTALVNDRGAASGYGGSGPRAYAEIMTFIEANEIKLYEVDWDDLIHDYPTLSKRLADSGKDSHYTGENAQIWSDFLSSYIWYLMPDLNYKASDKWKRKAETPEP